MGSPWNEESFLSTNPFYNKDAPQHHATYTNPLLLNKLDRPPITSRWMDDVNNNITRRLTVLMDLLCNAMDQFKTHTVIVNGRYIHSKKLSARKTKFKNNDYHASADKTTL